MGLGRKDAGKLPLPGFCWCCLFNIQAISCGWEPFLKRSQILIGPDCPLWIGKLELKVLRSLDLILRHL